MGPLSVAVQGPVWNFYFGKGGQEPVGTLGIPGDRPQVGDSLLGPGSPD